MPIFIISIFIQVALVIHIVKTGRNTTWIWIVVMLPMAGSIAYFIIEVLPELTGSRSGRKASSSLRKIINPNKNIKEAALNYSITDTIENSIKLAEECISKNMFSEAKDLYKKCLKGVHEHDPEIMQGLATAEFGLNNFNDVKSILDELIDKNPDYKNAEAHLLYAKSLEELKEIDLALQEYKALDNYYPGPEATYRYAMLLKNNGNLDKASNLINKILHEASYSGKHYNSLYKNWIKLARNETTS